MKSPNLKTRFDRVNKQRKCLEEIGEEIKKEQSIDPDSVWVLTLIAFWNNEHQIYLNLKSELRVKN